MNILAHCDMCTLKFHTTGESSISISIIAALNGRNLMFQLIRYSTVSGEMKLNKVVQWRHMSVMASKSPAAKRFYYKDILY